MTSVFPREYQDDVMLPIVDCVGLAMGVIALCRRGERRLSGSWFVGSASAAVLLAVAVPPGFFLFDETYSQERWMFGHYLECMAMLPQVLSALFCFPNGPVSLK